MYEPFERASDEIRALVEGPPAPLSELVTDDQPFVSPVDWGAFTFAPDPEKMRIASYASSWTKVLTVLLLSGVSLLVLAAARLLGRRAGRVPLAWLAYFFVSGVSYMAVEIGLMAKVELFLGNPLYAIAVILALFLLSNALGAYLQDKRRILRGPLTMILYTTLAVGWSVLAATLLNTHLLSLPLALKVVAVAVAVFPAGLCLGMYYPFGVGRLVAAGRERTIPMTYGIATLSSVLGSALAMTGITNVGFSTMIALGAAGYVLTAGVFALARRLA